MSDFITNAELRIEAERLCDENEMLRDDKELLQEENAKLRELCKSMRCALAGFGDKVYLAALDETLIKAGFDLQELGIEVRA